MRSDWLRQTDTATPNIVGLDFGFFLKISKEIGKAWRKDLMLAREPHTVWGEKEKSRSLFSASFQTFCVVWLLARTWIRKNTDCFAAVLQHCFSNNVGSCCVRSVCLNVCVGCIINEIFYGNQRHHEANFLENSIESGVWVAPHRVWG